MSCRPGSEDPASRVFVAVQAPAVIREHAAGLIRQCQGFLNDRLVRWAHPGDIHVTLRFIGSVARTELDAINTALIAAVRSVCPFTLQTGAPGCFPNARSPRVLWLALEGDLEPLTALQSKVSEHTRPWGRIEDREFHPHLTLGRVVPHKQNELERIATVFGAVVVPPCAPWSVEAIHLMQSDSASGQSRYSTLASFPLPG
jgi:2'-5' RNA ligase